MNSYGTYSLKCKKLAMPLTPADHIYVEWQQDFTVTLS